MHRRTSKINNKDITKKSPVTLLKMFFSIFFKIILTCKLPIMLVLFYALNTITIFDEIIDLETITELN